MVFKIFFLSFCLFVSLSLFSSFFICLSLFLSLFLSLSVTRKLLNPHGSIFIFILIVNFFLHTQQEFKPFQVIYLTFLTAAHLCLSSLTKVKVHETLQRLQTLFTKHKKSSPEMEIELGTWEPTGGQVVSFGQA